MMLAREAMEKRGKSKNVALVLFASAAQAASF
jgi:hypothetical protein